MLTGTGKVSHTVPKLLPEEEYEKFRVIQDREFESDFNKEVKSKQQKKIIDNNETTIRQQLRISEVTAPVDKDE